MERSSSRRLDRSIRPHFLPSVDFNEANIVSCLRESPLLTQHARTSTTRCPTARAP
ncbi:hypothetical protein M378DRAFT_165040, partial [Amanita muscaria Koide BX008]